VTGRSTPENIGGGAQATGGYGRGGLSIPENTGREGSANRRIQEGGLGLLEDIRGELG